MICWEDSRDDGLAHRAGGSQTAAESLTFVQPGMADWPSVLLNTSNDNIPRRPGGTPTTSATATATTTTTTYYDNVYGSLGGRLAPKETNVGLKLGGLVVFFKEFSMFWEVY